MNGVNYDYKGQCAAMIRKGMISAGGKELRLRTLLPSVQDRAFKGEL